MAERALQITYKFPPAYDVSFDRLNRNEPLIRKNLETDLGERFNVEISQVEYSFDGPFLRSTQDTEPFVETIKRGIRNRKKYAGIHDRRRELAEFENFNKVQTYLWQDENLDTKMITISPRGPKGSCYQHNFFDLYERTQDGKILMTRYSSQMSIDEFVNAARQIDPNFGLESKVDDVYFLQNPIKTKLGKNTILEIFHPDQEALKVEEHQSLISACNPLIEAYLKEPSEMLRRVLLNFADDYIFKPKARDLLQYQVQNVDFIPVYATQLAARPVRFVLTGCGAQGSLTLDSSPLSVNSLGSRPFSVAEFGRRACAECGGNSYHFHCPGCNGQIESGRGITKCPYCRLTKEQAGSRC